MQIKYSKGVNSVNNVQNISPKTTSVAISMCTTNELFLHHILL